MGQPSALAEALETTARIKIEDQGFKSAALSYTTGTGAKQKYLYVLI
jgi:hypothetical protein